jgi:hypothetical protein
MYRKVLTTKAASNPGVMNIHSNRTTSVYHKLASFNGGVMRFPVAMDTSPMATGANLLEWRDLD